MREGLGVSALPSLSGRRPPLADLRSPDGTAYRRSRTVAIGRARRAGIGRRAGCRAPATAETALAPAPTAEDSAEPRTPASSNVASAHARKPWAVSRKNTSSVWTPTHLVLQAAGHVAGETRRDPLHDHQPDRGGDGNGGEARALARPRRDHRQAEAGAEQHQQQRRRRRGERTGDDRTPAHGGRRRFFRDGRLATTETGVCIVVHLMPEEEDEDDDRDRNPEKPEQNSAAHDCLLRM